MLRRIGLVLLVILGAVAFLAIPPLFDGFRPERAHGTRILDWDGVAIYHHVRGHDHRGEYGLEYECVEFVNRWLVHEGYRNLAKTGHALSYFEQADAKGLRPFANGGTMCPMPGDVMVFSSSQQPYGHVGIVVDITIDRVRIIQQNAPIRILGGLLVKDRPLVGMKMVHADGRWTVEAPPPLTAIGWSRMPPK